MAIFKNRTLKSWAYYDFANSSYVLIFQAFLLPVFFSQKLDGHFFQGSWGIANGVSTVFGVIFAIFAGSYSDKNERIRSFKALILLTFIAMCILSISVEYYPIFVFYLYIITNTFFIATISLSDSLLTFISDKNNANKYSGIAWGWGYLGGISSLIVVIFLQKKFSDYSSFVFLFVAFFYLAFSIYALKGLRKNKNVFQPILTDIKDNSTPVISRKNKFAILVGYWLISESITVIILFFSIYASKELKISTFNIGLILLLVQLIGIFSTWFGGILADKFNGLSLLGISISLWLIIIGLMVWMPNSIGLGIIILLTGLVIGNSQSFLRAQFSKIIRKNEAGFQFGIFSIASQASVFIGPILFGFFSDILGSQKIPLLFTGGSMLVGFLLVKYIVNTLNNTVYVPRAQKNGSDTNIL